MKDNAIDPDSPLWTADDFAQALPARDVLPPQLASLLRRAEPTGLRRGLADQPPLARGLRLAA